MQQGERALLLDQLLLMKETSLQRALFSLGKVCFDVLAVKTNFTSQVSKFWDQILTLVSCGIRRFNW